MNRLRASNLMSLILVAAISAGLVLFLHPPTVGATPPGEKPLSGEDEKSIGDVVKGIEETWNTHDMAGMGNLFREDAEFINVVGMHWRGRNAIVAAHTAYHETMFKNHHIKTDSVEIRPVAEGAAIAVVTTTNDSFATPGGDVIPERQNRQTYVLTKRSDGWKIAHGHNVPVDPIAAKFDPANAPR